MCLSKSCEGGSEGTVGERFSSIGMTSGRPIGTTLKGTVSSEGNVGSAQGRSVMELGVCSGKEICGAVSMLSFLELVNNVEELVGTKVTQTITVEGMSVVITGTTVPKEVDMGWILSTESKVRLDGGITGLTIRISVGDVVSTCSSVLPGTVVVEERGLVMGWTIFAASSVVVGGLNGNEVIMTPSLMRSQMNWRGLKAILRSTYVVGLMLLIHRCILVLWKGHINTRRHLFATQWLPWGFQASTRGLALSGEKAWRSRHNHVA